MKTYETDYRINSDFVHHNLIDNENFSINFKDYPLGSMPREDSSFLISLLIQADIFPSPSCSTANSIALRNSGSNLNWNGGLPLREFFLSLCIDTLFSPVYIVCVSIHNTHTFTNKQAPEVLPALAEALITHLLKRSKSMTDYNSTPYTAIGASKICSRNEIHLLSNKDENLSTSGKLLKAAILGYYALAVAKSAAEPGNSNLTKGEQHAQRAFFVRSTRTPKENNKLNLGLVSILSMVACNGKGSPFADFLWCQFSSLLHVTAQTLESLAVALINQPKDTVMKRFKFLTGSRLIITIYANNRQEAENKIKWTSKPLLVARLRNPLVNNSQNPTACDTEQNHSLPSVDSCGYDGGTTKSLYADRKRNPSGIFLPKIHQYHGLTTPEIYSELAVRATRRNKADSIHTNNADCYKAVVEPLSHLFSDKPLSLTKTLYIMKKPTLFYKALIGTTSAIVSSPRFEGVQYA